MELCQNNPLMCNVGNYDFDLRRGDGIGQSFYIGNDNLSTSGLSYLYFSRYNNTFTIPCISIQDYTENLNTGSTAPQNFA